MTGEFYLYLNILLTFVIVTHVFRTNRPKYWIFVILISGTLGALIYFIFEILPELMGRPRNRKIFRSAQKKLNRKADLHQLEQRQEFTGSIDATRHLANTLIENDRATEAVAHYKNILTGIYKFDPDLLLGLAEAQFATKAYTDSIDTLDLLREKNPHYTSAAGHLIYARALEFNNKTEDAIHEYEALIKYYTGAEANFRYARLLEATDQQKALSIYNDILNTADIAPEHYRQAQKVWLQKAKKGITRVTAKIN
tara:strand:- start:157 stop:918 length:762 start_codon:yes stop_codon:yes gene_type:complete